LSSKSFEINISILLYSVYIYITNKNKDITFCINDKCELQKSIEKYKEERGKKLY
jgi:hypothetical protein